MADSPQTPRSPRAPKGAGKENAVTEPAAEQAPENATPEGATGAPEGATGTEGSTEAATEQPVEPAELEDGVEPSSEGSTEGTFDDSEHRVVDLVDNSHAFFPDTPEFLVRVALGAADGEFFTVKAAKKIIDEYAQQGQED